MTVFRNGRQLAVDKDRETSLCGMWASGVLYLRDQGRDSEAATYEEAVVREAEPDWLELFARVGVAIDPFQLGWWLKERPRREPAHLDRLDDVRHRLAQRRLVARTDKARSLVRGHGAR
jgi:hypothetical protein